MYILGWAQWNQSSFESKFDGTSYYKKKTEVYIESAPNNSNETYTCMYLGREGWFGQCSDCFKIKSCDINRLTHIYIQ